MFVRSFRSLHARFDAAGLGAVFAPRKPRHPLLRLGVGLLGVAVLVLLLALALVIGSVMIVAGLARRLLSRDTRRPVPDARVVDGEYRVLRKPVLPLAR
ncbi:hypothetical protein BH23PSE2_BH23PSE2_09100 [soil metagenome]